MLPEMDTDRIYASFLDDLHRLLDHLYDPAELLNSPLAAFFEVDQRADPINALRRIITQAIQSLQPDDDVPLQSSAWRYYNILFHRYVEQFTQKEVAADLALSVRQLRRQESTALGVLSEYLWARYDLEAKIRTQHLQRTEKANSEAVPDLQGVSREAELLWSQRSFSVQPTQLRNMVDSVLQTVEPLCANLNVAVESSIARDLPRLDVQQIPVQEALVNLVLLAARSAADSRIQIRARTHGQQMHVHIVAKCIGDVGTHVQVEEQEDLEIARKLVEFSGGRIRITSSHAPASILTIQVVLPTEAQITVVAIDDNPDTVALMKRYSQGTRYNLLGFQDPEQAIPLLESTLHPIVILDVMLPDTDGWTFLRRLRAHTLIAEIPVIICTVLPQEQLALAHGATGFLRKPISRDNFLSTLDTQIGLLWGKNPDGRLNTIQ